MTRNQDGTCNYTIKILYPDGHIENTAQIKNTHKSRQWVLFDWLCSTLKSEKVYIADVNITTFGNYMWVSRSGSVFYVV